MIVRSLVALLLAGILVLVPSLCAAGVLGHGCPDDGQAACEHESECAADPCSGLVARLPDGARGPGVAVEDGAAAVAVAPPALRATRPAPARPAAPAPPRGLPCAPSDLPLLN